MLKKQNSLKALVSAMRKMSMGLLIATAAFTSCSDNMSYFDTPSWLRGSIYEILQEDGQYSIFLQGAERAGFTPILNGKSILTVMAPTDAEMAKYLQENYGTTNIAQVPVEEVRKLIGFHILYYSFDKDKLVNFRPAEGDGATEEEQLVNAGLYFKFRTKSQDPVTVEQALYVNGATNAETETDEPTLQDVNVYHLERYVPVYSWQMFRTKTIDAKKNYEYFYPGMWRGDGGFNVSNAAVDEYNVIAKNGYIYRISNVMKPLETIYTELKARPDYSRYLKMYDEYSNYQLDSILSVNYGNGKDLYQHLHNNGRALAPIACEWPVTDYRAVSTLAFNASSVFAFSNSAFESFFNDFWGQGGYDSMDDPELKEPVRDLLLNSYVTNTLAFPDEIKRGLVLNSNVDASNPTPIFIETDQVKPENRVMCSNGVLYGCDMLTPPAKYGSVTGPAYQYKKFTYYLNMLNNSGLTNTLALPTEKYIMLYPTNEQMTDQEGYAFDVDGNLITVVGTTETRVSTSTKSATIYAHVCSPEDGNTILPVSGRKVLQAFTADKKIYWYVKDGKITNSIKHNDLLKYENNTMTDADIWADFHFLDYRGDANGWTNGHAYQYDKLLFHGDYNNSIVGPNFVSFMFTNRNDASAEFYGWVQLLLKSGLLNTSGVFALMSESSLMFVPVTNAVEQAIIDGKIPGISTTATAVGGNTFFNDCTVSDQEKLQKYLLSYLVPLSSAVMSNYPYPGWGENTKQYGGLITFDQDEEDSNVATRLNVYDNGTRLSVGRCLRNGHESGSVLVTDTYDSLPFTFDDGCVHFLEDVLPYYAGQE